MDTKPVFPLDQRFNQTGFHCQEDAFNAEELTWVGNLQQYFPFQAATVVGNTQMVQPAVRRSRIKWLHLTDYMAKGSDGKENRVSSHWLYEKLANLVQQVNNQHWGFDLHTIVDSIQYTEYHGGEGGHYNWHLDIGPAAINHRKISVTVQLSEATDYEGGKFQIWNATKATTLAKKAGTVVIFPSFMLHRITPVTAGIRKSLVLWVGGGSYR